MNCLSEEQTQLICSVFETTDDQIKNAILLKDGMTNRSFRFSVNSEDFIIRVPGEGTDRLVDRYAEYKAYQAISGKGFCDNPLFLDPDTGYKISRWIPQVRSCNPESISDLEQCMAMLRKLHGLNLKTDYNVDLFEKIEFYESLRNGKESKYPDYQQVKRRVFSLKSYVSSQRKMLCLAHLDCVFDNFLFYPEGGAEKLQLTDWEYAGMQDPHADLAMFCLYSGYGEEQTDRLIDIYLQMKCPDALQLKIYCYMAICGLMWSNWCEYKHIVGEDMGEYADTQYNYAKAYSKYVCERIDLVK